MRATEKLTALKISKLHNPGRYGDGLGLWLQVSPSGTKAWLFRFTLAGKAREMGLGPIHTVSLAEAREKAARARRLLLDGVDPIDARDAQRAAVRLEAASAITFRHCAAAYIETRKAGWKNAKHADQWQNTLKTYAYPVLGSLPVKAITLEMVLRVVEPIWEAKTDTASRVRGRIESILDWATVKGYRSGDNPARWAGNLSVLLAPKSKIAPVKNHAAMAYADVPHFMARLRTNPSLSARALEFTILTAVDHGVRERAPVRHHRYFGFVDPAGGSGQDSFTMAIGHREDDSVIIDAVREARPPFSPSSTIGEFAGLLRSYGIKQITGDRYAGEFPREEFRRYGIHYRLSELNKSEIYIESLPRLNSRTIRLLDNERLVNQITGLERRHGRTGRDIVDHAPCELAVPTLQWWIRHPRRRQHLFGGQNVGLTH